MVSRAAFLLPVVAASLSAQAAPDPRVANPERPTVATHAYAVAPGYVELEQGIRASGHQALGEGGFWEVNLKVGLTPWAQVALTGDPFVWNKQGSGLGDLGGALKERTAVSQSAAIALVESISTPTGNEALNLGTGRTLVSVVGVLSLDFASVWHVDLNAGPTALGAGRPQWLGTASWSWSASPRTTLELETFAYTAGAAGASTQGLLAGVAVRLTPQAVVDGGASVSGGVAGLRQVFAGLTLNLGRL